MDIQSLTKRQLIEIIAENWNNPSQALLDEALAVRIKHYGRDVYVRGLIECSNFCANDCYYCGIRRSNTKVRRYRLTKEDVMACCQTGYGLGLRTFVLQGGEDESLTDAILVDWVETIKAIYPDCAVTLSFGEKPKASCQALYKAGADRYLLRHETADETHYGKLHPPALYLANRKACLYTLKEIGFQTGAGFMVGAPFQTAEHLALDLLFLKELSPEMVDVGPFIPHRDTPFAAFPSGTAGLTATMLALTRLMLTKSLIPATTALASIDPRGCEKGLAAGANVIMPNLSPLSVRKDYALYNDKRSTGTEAAEGLLEAKRRVEAAGFVLSFSRGDPI